MHCGSNETSVLAERSRMEIRFMKKNLKRALTTAVAGVMSVNCLALSSVLQAGAAAAKYEFESGKLTGDAEVKTDDGNASGGSYVFLKTGGDEISLTVPSEKTGMYTVKVSCMSTVSIRDSAALHLPQKACGKNWIWVLSS